MLRFSVDRAVNKAVYIKQVFNIVSQNMYDFGIIQLWNNGNKTEDVFRHLFDLDCTWCTMEISLFSIEIGCYLKGGFLFLIRRSIYVANDVREMKCI